jgi:lysozyme
MSDPVNRATVELIKRNEGCRLAAYQDSVGVWTIGYGHTGDDVTEGLQISQDQAEQLLRQDLEKFQDGVDDAIAGDTSDNQFGAMVSLAFNIGLAHFKTSTVLREHNAGHYQTAADAFLLWNKAGGRVLPGLDRRRREERDQYLQPDVGV